MREGEIEQAFRKAVKKRGGLALKFTSPGFDGVPDRLALLPSGKMGFVEVKAPGKKAPSFAAAAPQALAGAGVSRVRA